MADAVESKSSGGIGRLIVALAVLTILAGVGGGILGWSLSDHQVPAPAAQATSEQPHGAATHEKISAPTHNSVDPQAGLVLKELTPIVTNLAGSDRVLVRLHASILYDPKDLKHPERLFAELASDTVAYLRTVEIASIEGTGGLRRLHEDLSERFSLRSEGRVRQLIIQSLVVQ